MTKFQYRFLFLTFLLFSATVTSLQAQRTLGVEWNPPNDRELAARQLSKFDELEISVIELQSPLPPDTWKVVDSLQFEVYGSLGIQFPTKSTFPKPDSTLIKKIQRRASSYLSQSSVTAIELFEYGAVQTDSFFSSLEPIAQQLRAARKVKLYYTGIRLGSEGLSATDFTVYDVQISPSNIDTLVVPGQSSIGAYQYSPSDKLSGYLTPFKKFLDQTSDSPKKPIFVSAGWLKNILDEYPQFAETLKGLTNKQDAIFPLPEESIPAPQSTAIPILILLFVWGTIALHYNSSPLYRKALFRYFTAHKFFIDDIYQRQIRTPFPALIIILQNVAFTATTVWIAFLTLFSPLGQEALFYHFSSFTIFGHHYFSPLTWTLAGTLIGSLVSIFWLYISNKSIKSITQIATIYAWPLHLNFLFGTIAIALFSSGTTAISITILAAFLIIIFLFSFILASVDTSRFAQSTLVYHLKTSVPYITIFGGLLVWILTNQEWMEVISLSLNLK